MTVMDIVGLILFLLLIVGVVILLSWLIDWYGRRRYARIEAEVREQLRPLLGVVTPEKKNNND
ncbi:MAG: hypothetical protein ACRC5T_03805 [Cetobacterium sp.]